MNNTEFYGHGLSKIELESRALTIDPAHRERESDYLDTRWFDYHAMHPTEATYLFAHHYREQSRAYHEKYVDLRTADQHRAFAPNDIFMSRDKTAMWIARGTADSLGIPYDFMMRFSGQRAYQQLYRGFPRPNQLYSEEFLIDLKEAWRERLTVSMVYSKAPGMRASEHSGTSDQLRHVAFVCAQIKRRPPPHTGLLRRFFKEDVLAPNLVRDHFPVDEISRSME